jgi:Uma2 family endonuclease
MNAVLIPTRMSAEEYLAWEASQEGKYEYVGCEAFAMVGGRMSHNRIAGNVFIALKQGLRGGPCDAFIADMKVQAGANRDSFYPDVVATCHPADLADGNALFISHPWLIAEVLSDNTAAYDRSKKFEAYRQIDTLTHYLLVDTHRPHADLFVKNAEGFWVLHPLGEADSVQVGAPHAFSWPVAAMFEGVSFEPVPPPASAA